MSTYTCPHCGQHDLSTQRRHNCPKLPSLSIPLGPPRSRDPIANEYIASLSRELEAARERCPVCGHEWCRHDPADGRCDAASEDPLRDGAVCPCGRDLAWMQARIAELSRRALAKDTEASDG